MTVNRPMAVGLVSGYLYQMTNYNMDTCQRMAGDVLDILAAMNSAGAQPATNAPVGQPATPKQEGSSTAAPSEAPPAPKAATGGAT